MKRVALKGLAWRKIRGVLTAIAIVLGVAMVSGAFILTDTMKKAADNLEASSYAGIDGIVTGNATFRDDNSWQKTPSISETYIAKVDRVPDVGDAVGTILDQAKLVDDKGEVIGKPPNFAVGIDASRSAADRLNPLTLGSGRWAAGPGEVAIDAGTARRQHLDIGDSVGVVAAGPLRTFKIVGLVKYGNVDSLGATTVAAFDLKTAQQLFDKQGEVDQIAFESKSGVSPAATRAEVNDALTGTPTEVQTAQAADPFDFKGLKSFVTFIKIFLLAFAGIALFVGAFIIFNTFAITVAQRTREFALLRTIGASRRQVLRSVVLEAFIIGLAATIVGAGLGVLIAKFLNAVMKAAEIDLPQAGMVFSLRTVLVSLLVGVVVTVLASIIPAVRATRVAPVAVLREGSTMPKSRWSPATPFIALGAAGGGFALLLFGMFGDAGGAVVHVLAIAGGTLALFIGVALLAPRLVRPIAWVVGAPAARFAGAPGRLARENATRNPGRTAVTASALMIGLALVTFVTVLAQGIRSSWGSTVRKQVSADYILTTTSGWDSFSPGAAAAIARTPGVEAVSSVRNAPVRLDENSQSSVSGLDTATVPRFFHFTWVDGSKATLGKLGSNGAIVLEQFAKDNHLKVGGPFYVTTTDGKVAKLVVRGIHKPAGLDSLLGSIAISNRVYDKLFTHPRNTMAFVATQESAPRSTLETALKPYPDVTLNTESEFVKDQNAWIDKMLMLLYVLLGLSVLVSLFGIVNTLVLSIVERTRELGALRAVGMTRRQLRRMIRHESVITALIGATMGFVLGIGLAALVIRRLSDYSVSTGGDGMHLALPIGSLVVFALAAVAAGILAAVLPARRAGRLNVLSALQYE
jgi:putative ABC transport system permease protein